MVKSSYGIMYLVLVSILLISGCNQQKPIVSMGDPAVYTSLHIYAAKQRDERRHEARLEEKQKLYKNKNDNKEYSMYSRASDLDRHFKMPVKDYNNEKLRMDDMLDQKQRFSDMLRVYETMFSIGLSMQPGTNKIPDLPENDRIAFAAMYSSDSNVQKAAADAKTAKDARNKAEKDLENKIIALREARNTLRKEKEKEEQGKVDAKGKIVKNSKNLLDEASGARNPTWKLESLKTETNEAEKENGKRKKAQEEAIDEYNNAFAEHAGEVATANHEEALAEQEKKDYEKAIGTNEEINKKNIYDERFEAAKKARKAEIDSRFRVDDTNRLKVIAENKYIKSNKAYLAKKQEFTDFNGLVKAHEAAETDHKKALEAKDSVLTIFKSETENAITDGSKNEKKALDDAIADENRKKSVALAAIAKSSGPLGLLRPDIMQANDSITDRLDRVNNFSNAYMLKTLLGGDSRAYAQEHLYKALLIEDTVRDPNNKKYAQLKSITDYIKKSQCKGTTKHKPKEEIESPVKYRLILLVFQAHIDPGNIPNLMAGLRVTITGASPEEDPNDNTLLDKVKILKLHPSRSYDIEDQLYMDKVLTMFIAQVSAMHPSSKLAANLRASENKMQEIRKNFLVRINKSASYADARRREFGWNFYPSNLQLRNNSRAKWLWELISSAAPPRDASIQAFLEPGARDCSVYLLVPKGVDRIELRSEFIVQSVDTDIDIESISSLIKRTRYNVDDNDKLCTVSWKENFGKSDNKYDKTIKIELPTYHASETAALIVYPNAAKGGGTPDYRNIPFGPE